MAIVSGSENGCVVVFKVKIIEMVMVVTIFMVVETAISERMQRGIYI